MMNRIFKNLPVLLLVGGLIVLGSCEENKKKKSETIKVETKDKELSDVLIDQTLLIGSWLDSSESALHFSMFQDGTAHSDNMKTLLYQKWCVEGQKLILTAKSIGNGNSSIDDEVYIIHSLTDEKMVLKNGEYLLEFRRKK